MSAPVQKFYQGALSRVGWFRLSVATIFAFFSWLCSGSAVAGDDLDHSHDTISHFIHDMPRTIRADHPAILPVVAAIRRISNDPLEQLVMVNDVTHLLVDYDEDRRVYGREEFHATLDEMLARRQRSGWLYLRDDCDGRAVFAAHLLASLGIPWRLAASSWKEHAWVMARVNGCEYDLLDLRLHAPETQRLSYRFVGHFFTAASRPPPTFDWRRAWAERTSENVQVGLQLGLLTLDSHAHHWRERHSTDWTVVAPGASTSPFDSRTLTAMYAGFPYGAPLTIGALAAAPLPPETANSKGKISSLGTATEDSKQSPRLETAISP